jgi:hypothetical protein
LAVLATNVCFAMKDDTAKYDRDKLLPMIMIVLVPRVNVLIRLLRIYKTSFAISY